MNRIWKIIPLKNSSIFLPFLFLFTACQVAVQKYIDPGKMIMVSEEPIQYFQIKSDTIFDSNQTANILIMQKLHSQKYRIAFGYDESSLLTTSSIASSNHAIAAINGGFFNMDIGGSVSYFEVDDKVINETQPPGLKWGISDSIRNGAIVLSEDRILTIESAKTDPYYASSHGESAVLITGPLLLLDGIKRPLPNIKFSKNRHPRTCVCETRRAYLFIAIDGRQENAEGMTLSEVQNFLLGLGCKNAINLDGGGSTTMWMRDQGVINSPSDKAGERPVSNALLILDGRK